MIAVHTSINIYYNELFGSKSHHPSSQGSSNSNSSSNGNKHALGSAGNGFFPSFTSQTATPTTAVSSSSYAMGTTGVASEDVISRMKAMNEPAKTSTQGNNVNQKIVIGVNDKPAIITTGPEEQSTRDEQKHGSEPQFRTDTHLTPSPVQLEQSSSSRTDSSSSGENDIPRGKLEVTIIEARGLSTISENSLPYVVCTFESSNLFLTAQNPLKTMVVMLTIMVACLLLGNSCVRDHYIPIGLLHSLTN